MFFIRKSTHDARIALKDQRIAELESDVTSLADKCDQLKAALDAMTTARDMWKRVASDVIKQRDELRVEQEQVYKRYEPFMHVTRGPGGKWVSTKQVGAQA